MEAPWLDRVGGRVCVAALQTLLAPLCNWIIELMLLLGPFRCSESALPSCGVLKNADGCRGDSFSRASCVQ
jgi:hypothetical protein